MNNGQLKAILRLEKGLEACSKAHIYLYVASGILMAYDAKAIDAFEEEGRGDAHEAMNELQGDAEIVSTYDTRIDGGDF